MAQIDWQTARAWAKRRRNPDKKVYAMRYLNWLQFGQEESDEPSVPNGLSYAIGRIVRIELHKLLGVPGEESTGDSKVCRDCDKEKDKLEFYEDRTQPDGFAWKCKECSKIREAQYRLDHPERRKRIEKQERRNNPDGYAIRSRQRRALEHGSSGYHTEEEWQLLCETVDYRCLWCGEQEPFEQDCVLLTRDHVVPLTLGGGDEIENIQPLCKSCNSAKGQQAWDFRADVLGCSSKI